MDQLVTLIEIGAWSALVTVPIIAFVKVVAGPDDLADGIALGYREAGWPHGVQEEEPVPWRLELLPRTRSVETSRGSRPRSESAQRCELAPSPGR